MKWGIRVGDTITAADKVSDSEERAGEVQLRI
jgi:hypothetical protein